MKNVQKKPVFLGFSERSVIMKKIIFSILALSLIAGSATCQEKIDIAKEEEAIKAAIKEEIALWLDGDYLTI